MDTNTAIAAHTLHTVPLSEAFGHHACMPQQLKHSIDLADVDAFLELHAVVTSNCGFVKNRTKADLQNHILSGHHAIGIFSAEGPMIGQALVTLPDLEGTVNLNGYPLGHGQFTPSKCAIIQAMGVNPEHKKCGLSTTLFKAAVELAAMEGRTHILAKMNVENMASFRAFEKAGYVQHGSVVQVPGENYTSRFMVKAIKPAMAHTHTHKFANGLHL